MSTEPEQPASELNDLSELDFSFEENDATSASPDTSDGNEASGELELDIDSLNIHGDPEDSRRSRNIEGGPPTDELDIDGFNIEGASTPIADSTAAPPTTPAAAPKPENATQPERQEYYVESLGQTLGPMGLTELAGMADSGALAEDDKVKKGEHGRWIDAAAINQVAAAFLLSTDRGVEGASTMSSVTARRLQSDAGGGLESDTGFELSNPPPKESPAAETVPGDSPLENKPHKTSAKKRRRGKKDELLEEIFSEVFTDEGTVRDDLKSRRTPVESSHSPASSAVTSGFSAPPPPPPPQPVSPPTASAPSSAAPPKAFTPPRPKAKSKSGTSFSMPSPKTLGIGGGVMALMLVVWFLFSGGLSLPAFAPNPTQFLTKTVAEYKQMASGTITEEQWKTFSTAVNKEAGDIIGKYAQVGALNSEQTEQRKAVAKLMSLASCAYDDTDKQAERFAQFEEFMEE